MYVCAIWLLLCVPELGFVNWVTCSSFSIVFPLGPFFFFLNSYFEHSSQPGLATRAFSLTPLPHSLSFSSQIACPGLWAW